MPTGIIVGVGINIDAACGIGDVYIRPRGNVAGGFVTGVSSSGKKWGISGICNGGSKCRLL
jgi:hypothetical protein